MFTVKQSHTSEIFPRPLEEAAGLQAREQRGSEAKRSYTKCCGIREVLGELDPCHLSSFATRRHHTPMTAVSVLDLDFMCSPEEI